MAVSLLVIDSSVVIKWFLPEPLAPDLIYAELGNIVWRKRTLQGFPPDDAQRIVDTLHALPIDTTPARTLLTDAYALAVAYGRTVDDALYKGASSLPPTSV